MDEKKGSVKALHLEVKRTKKKTKKEVERSSGM